MTTMDPTKYNKRPRDPNLTTESSPPKKKTRRGKKKSQQGSDSSSADDEYQSQPSQKSQDDFFQKHKVHLIFPELSSTEILNLCRKDTFSGSGAKREPLMNWGEEGGKLLNVPRLEDQCFTWLSAAGINDDLWNHLHKHSNDRRVKRFQLQKIPKEVLENRGILLFFFSFLFLVLIFFLR